MKTQKAHPGADGAHPLGEGRGRRVPTKPEHQKKVHSRCGWGAVMRATAATLPEEAQPLSVDQGEAKVRLCETLPLPVLEPPWTSTRKLPPLKTEIEVINRDWAVERHWRSLFEEGVLEESLEPFLCNSKSDYTHCAAEAGAERSKIEREARAAIAKRGATDGKVGSRAQEAVHRIRLQTGKASGEARIAWTVFVPDAQRILMKGFGFRVLDGGTVVEAERRRVPISRYAYDAEELKKILMTAPGARWPDLKLVDILRWGADGNADGMPPVCVLSSNHKTAMLDPEALEEIVRKEVEEALYGEPREHPHFVPF